MQDCIDFTIRVDVDDHNAFDDKKLFDALKEFADKNLGSTYWDYSVKKHHHYPNERKPVWCDACGEVTVHRSVDGDDFRCIQCQYNAILGVVLGEGSKVV